MDGVYQSLGPCTLGWIDPNEAAEEGVRDTKARSTTCWCSLLRLLTGEGRDLTQLTILLPLLTRT